MILRRALAVGLLLLTACSAPRHRSDTFSAQLDQLMAAERDQRPWPLLSASSAGLTVERAMRLQQALVAQRLRSRPLAGFKTGLVMPEAQRRFGLTEPLFGVLTADGACPSGATVHPAAFRRLMIEVELALIVAAEVTQPPTNDEETAALVGAIAVAFELPDLGYQPGQLRGVDILATNAGAAGWVLGDRATAGGLPVPPETLTLTLRRDGDVIAVGQVAEKIGDIWQVARWLLTRALSQGYPVEPGAVLLTGAVIGPLPAAPGLWVAEAESIGSVRILIADEDDAR